MVVIFFGVSIRCIPVQGAIARKMPGFGTYRLRGRIAELCYGFDHDCASSQGHQHPSAFEKEKDHYFWNVSAWRLVSITAVPDGV